MAGTTRLVLATSGVTALRELVLQQLTNTRGLPKRRASRTRLLKLWVGLWVENFPITEFFNNYAC
jgi:hypothetical protein